MKYLYFDCFAGFDVFMALGAVTDMLCAKDKVAEIITSSCDGAGCDFPEVKRAGMDATLASVCVSSEDKILKTEEILQTVSGLGFSEKTKEKLGLFLKIKSSARAMDPSEAEFSLKEELPEICACGAIFELLENCAPEKICVSHILAPDGVTFTENGFTPLTSAETDYISRKYGLSTISTPTDYELFTEGGAALLATLGATSSPLSGTPLKIGYGAGVKDIPDITNILRCVLGEENEGETLCFDAEITFAAMKTEFATV